MPNTNPKKAIIYVNCHNINDPEKKVYGNISFEIDLPHKENKDYSLFKIRNVWHLKVSFPYKKYSKILDNANIVSYINMTSFIYWDINFRNKAIKSIYAILEKEQNSLLIELNHLPRYSNEELLQYPLILNLEYNPKSKTRYNRHPVFLLKLMELCNN